MAINTRATSGTVANRYLHLDHQGSVAEISKDNGSVHDCASFSACGEGRVSSDKNGTPGTVLPECAMNLLRTVPVTIQKIGVVRRGYSRSFYHWHMADIWHNYQFCIRNCVSEYRRCRHIDDPVLFSPYD